MPTTMKFDLLMVAMRDELKRGRIVQRHMETDSEIEILDGYQEPNGDITIDPVPMMVDLVVHELLHRRYPAWTEARVCRTASWFVRAMEPAERRDFYRRYSRVAKKRRGVRKVDE